MTASQPNNRLSCCCLSGLLLFTFVASLSIPSYVQGYIVQVDSGAENECFHERVPIGVKLGFSYEVIEGGFFDIDVDVKDPNHVILHQDDRSTNAKITIEANVEGPYYFCFHNKRTSHTPKTIIFDIDRSDTFKSKPVPGAEGTTDDEESTKIMSMIENLMLAAISTRHDVRYLTARDRVHRQINEATNSRIVWWSGVEFIILLVVTLGQVWYLKRFFEIRRKV